MTTKTSLFFNEDEILQNTTVILQQYEGKNDIPVQLYAQLVHDYKKLLKQTKLLVKMSDKQQTHLSDKVEEVVRVSEKKLIQFLEAVPIGIFVVDAEGKVYYANQKTQQILGKTIVPSESLYQLREVCPAYLAGTEMLYPLDKHPIICALSGQTTTVDDMEIRYDDKVIPIEVWGTPIFNENHRISYAIGVFHDIAERKQAEANKVRLLKEQEKKNAELTQLNQEKNEFLGIAAHDLKNPLSAILGMAEMVQESVDTITSTEMLEYCSIIQRSARIMFQLITNLLDVNAIESKGINLHLESINLFPILQNIVDSYRERAKVKNIKLQFDATNDQYIAFIDLSTAQQILDNLISNAIKYSPYGKTVHIRICHDEQFIRCEIRDEGMGLSPADQKKLFGKFTRLTTKPTGGEHSTGLGLFIVKKLVDMMQGKVWCESELGKGATFIVKLPVC